MLAEVRVLLERSAAGRLTLEGLLDALPADYWDRVAAGEAWSIRQHVGHLAGADEMMSELVEDVLSGATGAWVGRTEDPAMLASMRQRFVSVAESRQPPELRELATGVRSRFMGQMASLQLAHLDAFVYVAGAIDRWGQPVRWPLREYLAAWTAHDPEHEASIRRAMTTPPDLSAVALTRRRRS